VEPPHPSALREPPKKFRAYYCVTKGWEVGIYTVWYAFVFPSLYPCSHPYFRAIAESRLTGVVGGSAVKMSKNWQNAYHYYSISYYAGVVKLVPQRLVAPKPIANRPFASPATGSPSHPIYIASTQVTPASGTPTHPYIIPSTPNSPMPGPALRQRTTKVSSIPALLSQGSPSPAFRPRQFLRARAPVAQPTPAAASGSIPQLSFAVGPIPANSCVSITATVDVPQPNVDTTTPNTTPHRQVVYVVGSDSDVNSDSDDKETLPFYPYASTHFTSEAGSSIHTNPSTPTNVASHRTSITPGAGSYIYTNPLTPTSVASRTSSLIVEALVVEADEDEFACSDFDDPEFLEQLNAVLASQPSPN